VSRFPKRAGPKARSKAEKNKKPKTETKSKIKQSFVFRVFFRIENRELREKCATVFSIGCEKTTRNGPFGPGGHFFVNEQPIWELHLQV
jgi:hypothetical protein